MNHTEFGTTVSVSGIKQTFRSFTWLSTGEVLNKGLAFIATIYLARSLGVAGLGVIGFATAVLSYFDLIVDAGLATVGAREVSRAPQKSAFFATNIVTLRLLLALISFGCLYLFVTIIPKPDYVKLIILLYGLTLFTFALLLDWLFLATHKAKIYAISSFIIQACFTFGVFLLIHHPDDAVKVPMIQTLSEVVAVLVLLGIALKQFPFKKTFLDIHMWKELISNATPVALGHVMRGINYSFDVVLIGFLMPAEYAGWYVAAYRVVLLIVGFAALYYRSFLPSVTRCFQQSLAAGEHILQQSLKGVSVVIFPVATAIILMAHPILQLVYGPGYENSIAPLQLLTGSVICIALNGNFQQSLIATDRQSIYLRLSALSAATNVTLNLFLIPKYGLSGAAFSTFISELIFLISGYFTVSRHVVKVPLLKPLVSPLVATLCMALVIHFMRPHGLAISLVTGLSSYIVLLFLLKTITFTELKELFQ